MKKLKITQKNSIQKLSRFGIKSPVALAWYCGRLIRQNLIWFYLKFIKLSGFSRIGKNVTFDGIPKFLFPCSKIEIGSHSRVGSWCVFQGNENSNIIIGKRVTINDGAFITSNYSITIGDNTSIGEYVSIRDYNHKYDKDIFIKDQGYIGAPINIGCDCWIGRGVIILPGVSIGTGSVIAANSVVNKDIGSYQVYGGVPAKFLKNRV